MKRIVLCIAIIAVITVGSVLSLYYMDEKNDQMFESIDNVIQAYEQEQSPLDEIEKLEKQWDKYYITQSYVTHNLLLDEISSQVSRLRYIYENDPNVLLIECENIKYRLQFIYDSEFPHLYSIF